MLVGLCGAAGCGKDTLAHALVLKDGFEQYRFADPLKRMLREFQVEDHVWEDRELKEAPLPWLGRSPRYLAQTLGTEWGRSLVHEDVWVMLARERWRRLNEGDKGLLVVSDVRFINEARWIKSEGGCLLQILRPGHNARIDNKGHVSEQGIPGHMVSGIVYNDGTKDELRDKAWERIHRWRKE